MRIPIRMCLLAAACAEPNPAADADPCWREEPPSLRLGKLQGGEFMALADGETLEPFASPQGGFGVLLELETEGVGAGPEHEVAVEIVGELDASGGEQVARYSLDVAQLMCDEPGPGRWGTILVTLDPARFGTLGDLGEIAGRDIVLRGEVVDSAGTVARGEQTIRVAATP